MHNASINSGELYFLQGDGEMARLIREKDWEKTILGSPSTWPAVLKSALSIILSSKFPMFLWWGDALTCFYNDAYRPSLGNNGKHPGILGEPAEQAWKEIWPVIKPLIDRVLNNEGAVFLEDQLIPIYRNGKLEDVYWTFSYSPVKDDTGITKGVLVVCTETTEKFLGLKKIAESEKRFRDTVMQAPMGICLLRGKDFIVEMVNETYLQLVDREEKYFKNKPLFDSLPEVKDFVAPLLDNVLKTGEPYYGKEFKINIKRAGKEEDAYFNFVYQPLFEDDGSISGIMVIAIETTDQVQAKFSIQESERQFSSMIMESPIAMTIWRGEDHIIEVANTTLLKNIWRKEPHEVFGKKALDVFPELLDQKYPALLKKVFTDGITYRENESLAYVGLQKFYLDFEYSPLKEKDGTISGIMITVYDVTQKVEARQSLEDAEARMRLAAEGTGLATWDLDLKTKKIIYSPRLAIIFGYDESKILTHAEMREHIHPDDRQTIVEKAFDKALETGVYDYYARLVHPDNTIRWIHTQGKVIFDKDKKPLRMLGTMMDITEQKSADEKLASLAAIVQSTDDAIISKRLDGIITSWNGAAERIFGYTATEMIGRSILTLIPEDKVHEEVEIIRRLKKGERIKTLETQRLTKNKVLLDISLTISPIRDNTGNIIGASKICRDITQQKKTERLITENEEKFRLLANSMPQHIWTGDTEGSLNYFNKSVYDYSGLNTEELMNGGWVNIIHPDDREENIKNWLESVSTGNPFLFEHRFRRHDGEYRWQLSRAIPQKDADGNIRMWVGTSTDIDELKKHEQQKDDFIKMASHELKTPVTSIKGYVQLLLKMYNDNSNELLTSSLITIDKQVSKLTKLITDLLDVTKIETGTLGLNKEVFNINELTRSMIKDMHQISASHQIILNEKNSQYILADKDRISQVLTNFFTNAIKYSPRADKVIVEISSLGNDVIVAVQDFGIGIASKDFQKIFERFYRVAGKDEKTFPGFGIGLFIVKEIIEGHNGKTWVESNKDQGSTFYFSLPIHSRS